MNTDATLQIPQHSDAYGLLNAALEYPDEELVALINDGSFVGRCRQTLGSLYPELEADIDWRALSQAGVDDELAVEYSRLFDVGAAGPPCPLYGGVYQDSRMPTLEELVRFYNYAGLTAEGAGEELPDHISVQLDFLYYLCYCEEQLRETDDSADFQRLQRDFINRHPGRWLPKLCERLQQHHASPFYQSLFQLISGYLRLEQQRLNSASARIASSTAMLN